jgi:phosphoenolpyruvate synthase/pyruvate phosphate dikinase
MQPIATESAKLWAFLFNECENPNSKQGKLLYGGKGAALAEMTKLELPVPPGFIITTECCNAYHANEKIFPDGMWAQTREKLNQIEAATGKKFGDPENPLLVSVRSGSPVSMPGMMDTVLNLGLNDKTVAGLARQTGDERFAWDAYRRFISLFSQIVLGVEHEKFERVLERYKNGGRQDSDLTVEELKEVVAAYKRIVFTEESGMAFPENAESQLKMAIAAVFDSWMGKRAVDYRRVHRISEDLGTAVNIQAMVFGNMGETSGTGVCFTRNPSTGEKILYGEYLLNAQGEDVVAGIRTPNPIGKLQEQLPEVYRQLAEITTRLERHYHDMQDIEFTIENGRLFMLQTRGGKRTGAAAVKVAVAMFREGLIDQKTALKRVSPEQLDQLLHPMIDPNATATPLAAGLPASPGAAQGVAVFSPDEAEEMVKQGHKVILVRRETSPDDFHGMVVAEAILTQRGGMTCVAGETKILTNCGLLKAEDAFALIENGARLKILSFDSVTLQLIWRDIIAAGRKSSEVITVAVSQTGRAQNNTLRLTADHKMFVLQNRKLAKKRLDAVLKDKDFALVVDRLPALEEKFVSPSLAYLAGAIFSDGNIRLRETKGAVTFIQKPTPQKLSFINAVETAFEKSFNVPFTYTRKRTSESVLRGRAIRGSVEDRISFRREPAVQLSEIRENLCPWISSLDENALLNFLAGFADGDGTYAVESSAVRLQITVSRRKQNLLEGIALACLRLGIVPQISNNREHFVVQITECVADILEHTNRLKAEIPPRFYESKCFAMRGLFTDIVDEVNFMGRVREALKRNLLFGVEKIRRDILPLCSGENFDSLERLLDAPLRSYRIKQTGETEETLVYNFEVDAEDDLDKNFIVFSNHLTPILVSNSHAAVVARGMGKPCVAGATALNINYSHNEFSVGDVTVTKGEWITLDGSTGKVFRGQVPTVQPALDEDFDLVMSWADAARRLKVRANSDTGHDSGVARNYGAEGIGLCRTEHMFFGEDRLAVMREMIMARGQGEREKALAKLLPFQKQDFCEIFRAMNGLPVTIRLLDPPLHEFLPSHTELLAELTEMKFNARHASPKEMDFLLDEIAEKRKVLRRVEHLSEANPMLGLRGCRLGLLVPEVTRMQVRAIFEAACEVQGEGLTVLPEVMIPLVSTPEEFRNQAALVRETAAQVMGEHGVELNYMVGTMIELPRAALVADKIAQDAEFFSFGTNDLTQTTFGLSRDDSGRFLPLYVEKKIYPDDPFQTLDCEGVGELIKMAIERGRRANPKLKIGVCGEHGGDPRSIEFFNSIGLDYVSCSPFRVPIARLSSAQSALEEKK